MEGIARPAGRRYRPARSAPLHHLWDLGQIVAGLVLILAFQFRPLAVGAGVISCLFGAWGFLSTRYVLNTWITTTSDQIVSVHPRWHLTLRWDQVGDVLVRERPSGMMPGRADRMVILEGRSGQRLPLNTSVLSVEDEEELLTEISSRVKCPIRTVRDGPWSGGGWVPQR